VPGLQHAKTRPDANLPADTHQDGLSDINEITTKTGNFKAYPVFLKMLLSALRQSSDSVCVDLLTYSDLEVLKAKRLRRAGHDVPLPASNGVSNNKRYLILTYQGEFDKVHYPLPLAYDEYPDPSVLKRTIANLRGALALATAACCSTGLQQARTAHHIPVTQHTC
jgi:hypothetical protein